MLDCVGQSEEEVREILSVFMVQKRCFDSYFEWSPLMALLLSNL